MAPPSSEWLEIMLGEIERKRAEAVQALAEDQARERERAGSRQSAPGPSAPSAPVVPEPAPISVRVSRS
jgi:hypothetical protein